MAQDPMGDDLSEGLISAHYDADTQGLMDRWQPLSDWMGLRLHQKLDPTSKVTLGRVGAKITALDRAGRHLTGINMASQDHLNLSSHPRVIEAAQDAARRFGVHSAGPAAQMGLTTLSLALEQRVAHFLDLADATVFASGLTAAQATVQTLLRAGDHVVMDALAPDHLLALAQTITPHVHRVAHTSTDAVAHALSRIRADMPKAGVLVMTEALSAMDSGSPDLGALQALCHRAGATLLVDVSQDLGMMGPEGRGIVAAQGMQGRIDVICGSFARCFATAGGFVASNHPALKLALRLTTPQQTQSATLSPIAAAAALMAFDITESRDGAARRDRLLANSVALRNGLLAAGFDVPGDPGPMVPVRLGPTAFARRITAGVMASGALVNLIESSLTPRHGGYWALNVMADHSEGDIAGFVKLARMARDSADEMPVGRGDG